MRESGGWESCPAPHHDTERVQMAHGGGGRMMQRLIREFFRTAFDNPLLAAEHDGAAFSVPGKRMALTTDAYVIQPLFFPGGDIGSLAVHGTVNDLAMCGARPLYLSASFILEEGLPLSLLKRVVHSMATAAAESGVSVVTGDTKVVECGKADGLYISTAGVGSIDHDLTIGPAAIQPGDAVLLSGDLGRHGIAVLAARESLQFGESLLSDCASLAAPVGALLDAGMEIHCLRDLTRGGLAAGLVETASKAQVQVEVEESRLEVLEPVRGACELLGLDPLLVANEGRFVAYLPERDVSKALRILKDFAPTANSRQIGKTFASREGRVTLITPHGTRRVLDLPNGEQLPRIC